MIINITEEKLKEILNSIHCHSCDEYNCDNDELVEEAFIELQKNNTEEISAEEIADIIYDKMGDSTFTSDIPVADIAQAIHDRIRGEEDE